MGWLTVSLLSAEMCGGQQQQQPVEPIFNPFDQGARDSRRPNGWGIRYRQSRSLLGGVEKAVALTRHGTFQ